MIPRRFFWLFDILVLVAAFLTAYLLVPSMDPLFADGGLLRDTWVEKLSIPTGWDGLLPPLTELLWLFVIIASGTLLFLEVAGNYGPLLHQSYTRIVVGSTFAPLAGLSVMALVLFAFKAPAWSRLFVFSFVVLSGLVLALYRVALRLYFSRRQEAGYYAKNVLLVGQPGAVAWMERYFADSVNRAYYRVFGSLQVDSERQEAQTDGTRAPVLGSPRQLGDLLISRPIHEVIAVHPTAGGTWIEQVIRDCDALGVLLRIVPGSLLAERRTLRTLYPFEPLNLPAVTLAPPHWDSDALFLKRLFDIVVSGLLLLLLVPVFIAIAIAIQIPTPRMSVFYPWRVVGKNGVEFTGYKFTTMQSDADVVKSQLLAYNEMSGPVFKMKDDPRITPLGKFLRKYSLNELPQLWSVLKGDMSLVGPRPAFRHELDRYEFWHKRKLSVRPGITCLWQVRGRNKISNFDDWVRMDLEYIDNWSLWLDVKILARTAWAVVAGTGS
jgi:exopolysaccharide biosynthesis polyprenyl glycosylphosphotransferase